MESRQQLQQQQKTRDYSHIHFEDPKFRDAYLDNVMKATQSEEFRGPVPGEGITYPEEKWVEFTAVQKGKTIQLNTYRWAVKGERKAVFIIFHGLNSHIGRSAFIAKIFAENGIETVGFDYRGFGKSEGIRGWGESFEQHIGDVERFVKIVEEKYPKEKIFVGGQSWGGQTAYKLALDNPTRYAGAVLFAPAIKDNKKNAPIGKQIARFVGCLFPSVTTVEQKTGMANKNPAVSESSVRDPYMYTAKIIPGTVRTVLNGGDAMEATFSQFKAPFLVLTAGVDKLVDPFLGFDLMKASPSKDKEHIFFENCWHNMWGEVEIDEIIKETLRWILQRA